MRSLSIGNSFSEDACGFLHQISESIGIDWECVNLYIGGCSLAYHMENVKENRKNYDLQINGKATGEKISIEEALTAHGRFDLITLQQASHFSGKSDSYFPYIEELAILCRKYQPDAEIRIHQTWAYESDSNHNAFPDYHCDQRYMYNCLHAAYSAAAEQIGVKQIPCGDTIQYLRENISVFDYKNGGISLNRDGFHISIPLGRCILAYIWLESVLGADVRNALFIPENTDEKTAALFPLVRDAIHQYINQTHN